MPDHRSYCRLCGGVCGTRVYERADITMFNEIFVYPEPFAQHTPALVEPPAGSEVADEWLLFGSWRGVSTCPSPSTGYPWTATAGRPPKGCSTLLARDAQVPLAEVRRHPGGAVFKVPPQSVAPAGPKAERFAVAPDDVVAELAAFPTEKPGAGFTHRLAVRRMREVINSAFHHPPAIRRRAPHNPACLHPGDLAALGLGDGQRIVIESAHGKIPAIVEADDSLKPGTVTISHGWGGLPDHDDPYEEIGSSTNRLIGSEPVEPINAMAWMTGVPVRIRPG